jgi:hypothetical protein
MMLAVLSGNLTNTFCSIPINDSSTLLLRLGLRNFSAISS